MPPEHEVAGGAPPRRGVVESSWGRVVGPEKENGVRLGLAQYGRCAELAATADGGR